MNTQEFRLHNLVQSEYEGVLIVRDIAEEFILASKEKDGLRGKFAMNAIRGLELSEEWLNRCGFTKFPLDRSNDYQGRADLNFGYPILYLNEHTYLAINCSVPNGYIFLDHYRIDCKYVHQLQNLFYSLTGQELTIKQ